MSAQYTSTTRNSSNQSKRDLGPYLFGVLLFIFLFGMLGYKLLYGGSWMRAFYDTAITVSTLSLGRGQDVEDPIRQLFIAILALLSGIFFLTFAAYIITHMLKYYE